MGPEGCCQQVKAPGAGRSLVCSSKLSRLYCEKRHLVTSSLVSTVISRAQYFKDINAWTYLQTRAIWFVDRHLYLVGVLFESGEIKVSLSYHHRRSTVKTVLGLFFSGVICAS